jgi:hypothetical protein
MAPLYEIAGEYTQYTTAIIEATDAQTAREIWYQNYEKLGHNDVSVECNIEDEFVEGIDPDFTMDDYDKDGFKIA